MRNKKGFTLAELMVVVAIIGVLVAVSIPVFSQQLEKSREATDLANVRAKYAEVMAEAMGATTPYSISKSVDPAINKPQSYKSVTMSLLSLAEFSRLSILTTLIFIYTTFP